MNNSFAEEIRDYEFRVSFNKICLLVAEESDDEIIRIINDETASEEDRLRAHAILIEKTEFRGVDNLLNPNAGCNAAKLVTKSINACLEIARNTICEETRFKALSFLCEVCEYSSIIRRTYNDELEEKLLEIAKNSDNEKLRYLAVGTVKTTENNLDRKSQIYLNLSERTQSYEVKFNSVGYFWNRCGLRCEACRYVPDMCYDCKILLEQHRELYRERIISVFIDIINNANEKWWKIKCLEAMWDCPRILNKYRDMLMRNMIKFIWAFIEGVEEFRKSPFQINSLVRQLWDDQESRKQHKGVLTQAIRELNNLLQVDEDILVDINSSA